MRFFFETPETNPKTRASIWIEEELKARLKEIADLEEVSFNEVCRVFLDLMAEEYEADLRTPSAGETPWLYD